MAFDKNHTTTGMKVVIVVFCVILVLSLCVPFISSCSVASDAGSQADEQAQQESSSGSASTVASVKQRYSGVISNLESKLAADSENTTAMASLGNNYMDMASAMRSATDASDNADEVEAAFAKAAEYYDMYLERASSQAVSVDRAVCLFYGGKADEGTSTLEEYVKGDGADYAMAWFNLGIMHYTGDTPDYEAAVEEFNKAAELDADGSAGVSLNAQIYAQLAQNMIDAQSSDEAEDGADSADSTDAAGTDADADGSDAQAEGEAGAASDVEDGSGVAGGSDADAASQDGQSASK